MNIIDYVKNIENSTKEKLLEKRSGTKEYIQLKNFNFPKKGITCLKGFTQTLFLNLEENNISTLEGFIHSSGYLSLHDNNISSLKNFKQGFGGIDFSYNNISSLRNFVQTHSCDFSNNNILYLDKFKQKETLYIGNNPLYDLDYWMGFNSCFHIDVWLRNTKLKEIINNSKREINEYMRLFIKKC